jgi:hypothetical protein
VFGFVVSGSVRPRSGVEERDGRAKKREALGPNAGARAFGWTGSDELARRERPGRSRVEAKSLGSA